MCALLVTYIFIKILFVRNFINFVKLIVFNFENNLNTFCKLYFNTFSDDVIKSNIITNKKNHDEKLGVDGNDISKF